MEAAELGIFMVSACAFGVLLEYPGSPVHQAFPDRVTPQYNLVSFSTVPYVEARRRGAELDALLDQITARIPAARLPEIGDDAWKAEVRQCAAA